MPADDRDERLLHRLEAFSDIVIGFSLAQVGGSLVVADGKGITDFLRSGALIGYAITFIVVSSIWWGHNRLFAKYFVPKPAMVIMNFAMLGCLGLFMFSIQVLTKAGGSPEQATAGLEFYVTMFGLTYTLLGVMYLTGSLQRRLLLSAEDFRKGMIRGIRLTTLAIGFLIAVTVMHRIGLHVRTIGFLFIPGTAAMIAVTRILPRFFPQLRKPPKGALHA